MPYPFGSIGLANPVGTTSDTDVHATHYDFLGNGGHRSVETMSERNNITLNRRKFGMLVTVTNDGDSQNNKTYILCNSAMDPTCTDNVIDNINWKEFSAGSSGPPIDVPNGPTYTPIYKNENEELEIKYLNDTRNINSFPGNTFSEKLYFALTQYVPFSPGVIIDCTLPVDDENGPYYNDPIFIEGPPGGSFVIAHPCTLRFGAHAYVFEGFTNALFVVISDNVTIEGLGNTGHADGVTSMYDSPKKTQLIINQNGSTIFHIKTSPRYAFIGGDVLSTIADGIPTQAGADYIPRGIENLNIRHLDLLSVTPGSNWAVGEDGFVDVSLSEFGNGGILLTEEIPYLQSHPLIAQSLNQNVEEPQQSRYGSFTPLEQINKVKNCKIEYVTLSETYVHGITIIGGSNIEINFCNFAKTGGHSIFVGGIYLPLTDADDPDFGDFLGQMKGGGSKNIVIKNCTSWSPRYADVFLINAFDVVIDNFSTTLNGGRTGIYVNNCKNVKVTNCNIANTQSLTENITPTAIPRRLLLRVASPAGNGSATNLYVNDISARPDNDSEDRYYLAAGISYLVYFSENVIFENCISKDPGSTMGTDYDRANSQFTSHFSIIGRSRGIKIINPILLGDSKMPYCYALRNYPSYDLVQSYEIPRDVFIDVDPLVEIKKLSASSIIMGQTVNLYSYIEQEGFDNPAYDVDQTVSFNVNYVSFKRVEDRPAPPLNFKTNRHVDGIILHQNGNHIMTTLFGDPDSNYGIDYTAKGHYVSTLRLAKGSKEITPLNLTALGIYKPFEIEPTWHYGTQSYRFLVREDASGKVKFLSPNDIDFSAQTAQSQMFPTAVIVPPATAIFVQKYGFLYLSPVMYTDNTNPYFTDTIGTPENNYNKLPVWGTIDGSKTTLTKIAIMLEHEQSAAIGWDGTNHLDIEFFIYNMDTQEYSVFPIAFAGNGSMITPTTPTGVYLEYGLGYEILNGVEKWAIRFKNHSDELNNMNRASIKSVIYFTK